MWFRRTHEGYQTSSGSGFLVVTRAYMYDPFSPCFYHTAHVGPLREPAEGYRCFLRLPKWVPDRSSVDAGSTLKDSCSDENAELFCFRTVGLDPPMTTLG